MTVIIPTRRSELLAGIKATLPLVVGILPFGAIFGAVAMTGALTASGTVGMSAFVFAGTAQMVGIELLSGGSSLAVILLATLIINMRLVFYSAALGWYTKHLPQRWLVPLAALLTDQTFVVVMERFQQSDASPFKHWYFLGSAAFMYVGWQVSTWIGMVAGQSIPNPRALGLDFAASVTFIAMVIPMIRNRPALVAVVVASAVSILAHGLPYQMGLLVATLLGMLAGYLVHTLRSAPKAPIETVTETQS